MLTRRGEFVFGLKCGRTLGKSDPIKKEYQAGNLFPSEAASALMKIGYCEERAWAALDYWDLEPKILHVLQTTIFERRNAKPFTNS